MLTLPKFKDDMVLQRLAFSRRHASITAGWLNIVL
jgi:hypothetical protein